MHQIGAILLTLRRLLVAAVVIAALAVAVIGVMAFPRAPVSAQETAGADAAIAAAAADLGQRLDIDAPRSAAGGLRR